MALKIRNISTPPESAQNVTIFSITLVPSCGSLVLSDCPAAADDPGVLRPSATGSGAPGTACASTSFTISLVDSVQGKYQFTPTTQVVLGPPGSAADSCVIAFAVDVVRAPTKDADPAPGLQTAQLTAAQGMASDGAVGTAAGASEVTINNPPVPAVTSVTPNAGSTTGGNTVTIHGTNFVSGAAVAFGSTVVSATFVSTSTLTAKAPARAAGLVNVRVHTPGGTSAVSSADHFTYDAPPSLTSLVPNSGSTAGGNTVTIHGTNFVSAAVVGFGSTRAVSVTFVSPSTLTVKVPAHAAGVVNVRVSTPGGTTAVSSADRYTYQ